MCERYPADPARITLGEMKSALASLIMDASALRMRSVQRQLTEVYDRSSTAQAWQARPYYLKARAILFEALSRQMVPRNVLLECDGSGFGYLSPITPPPDLTKPPRDFKQPDLAPEVVDSARRVLAQVPLDTYACWRALAPVLVALREAGNMPAEAVWFLQAEDIAPDANPDMVHNCLNYHDKKEKREAAEAAE